MGDAFAKGFLRRGAVLLCHRFQFADGPHPKFVVLMEDYDPARPDTVVALPTSKMRFRDRLSVVYLPPGEGGMDGEGLLDCNNCHKVPTAALAALQGYTYKGQLSEALMVEVERALLYATQLPEDIALRLLGPED